MAKYIYPELDIADVTSKMLKTYRVYLAQTKDKGEYLAPVTQGYYVIALRSMLRYLRARDYEVVSPERLELPRARSIHLSSWTTHMWSR